MRRLLFLLLCCGGVNALIGQTVVLYTGQPNAVPVKISAAGTGTVTNVATTAPITGGPITTTGTIACPTCVTSAASLTSTAFMTGAGSQASQTACATCTLDSSGNAALLSLTTGLGGSVGGYVAFGQGTATVAPTSSVGFMAPTSVTTKFMMTLPGAPVTGLLLNTGTTDPSAISFVTAIPNGFTATTQSASDNSTKIATTAYVDRVGIASLTTTGTSGPATFSGGTLNIPQYSGGGGTPAAGGGDYLFGTPSYTASGAGFPVAQGAVSHSGASFSFINKFATSKQVNYNVTAAGATGSGIIIGIYSVDTSTSKPTTALCTAIGSGTNATATGVKTIAWSAGANVSGGVCTLTLGSAYAYVMSSDDTTLAIETYNDSAPQMANVTNTARAGYASAMTTGTGAGLAFTTLSGLSYTAVVANSKPVIYLEN